MRLGNLSLVTILGIIMYIIVAWCVNVFKLVSADFETPYKTEIVRSISLVPVISAVTAFMDIGEEENK